MGYSLVEYVGYNLNVTVVLKINYGFHSGGRGRRPYIM